MSLHGRHYMWRPFCIYNHLITHRILFGERPSQAVVSVAGSSRRLLISPSEHDSQGGQGCRLHYAERGVQTCLSGRWVASVKRSGENPGRVQGIDIAGRCTARRTGLPERRCDQDQGSLPHLCVCARDGLAVPPARKPAAARRSVWGLRNEDKTADDRRAMGGLAGPDLQGYRAK